jgi:hypothetical protein
LASDAQPHCALVVGGTARLISPTGPFDPWAGEAGRRFGAKPGASSSAQSPALTPALLGGTVSLAYPMDVATLLKA